MALVAHSFSFRLPVGHVVSSYTKTLLSGMQPICLSVCLSVSLCLSLFVGGSGGMQLNGGGKLFAVARVLRRDQRCLCPETRLVKA